jgi:mannose-6-phosphate isomerase-like protein (cupin superfamily)
MPGFVVKPIDDMATTHQGAVKLAADELDVESFGMQVMDFPAGFPNYPEHDHEDDQMEEVYVVLGGGAEFEIDGERVTVDPGRMLRVAPEARRKLVPGPEGVRLLAIGCTIGRAYERHPGFRVQAADPR